MTFWFRHKYKLAPTDPRFLDMTMAQIETEYWAYHYLENPASEEIEDEDFDEDGYLAEIEARDAARAAEVASAAAVEPEFPPDPGDWEDIE